MVSPVEISVLCLLKDQQKVSISFVLTESIFEPLYFLKSCLIFDELVRPVFSKYNGFL